MRGQFSAFTVTLAQKSVVDDPSAPYGFDMYYLNVMAGPTRKWRFTNDPRSDHIFVRDGGKKPE